MAFFIGLVAIVVLLLMVLLRPKKKTSLSPAEIAQRHAVTANRHGTTFGQQTPIPIPKDANRYPKILDAQRELRVTQAVVDEKLALVTQAQAQLTAALTRHDAARERLRDAINRRGETGGSDSPGRSGERKPG